MVLEKWTDMCRKMNLQELLTPHTRINSKWIKILKENIASKILHTAHSNILPDIQGTAQIMPLFYYKIFYYKIISM